MLNTREIKNVINTVIVKRSKEFQTSVEIKSTDKPNYNNGVNQYKLCNINLPICKEFYKENANKDIFEKKCPYGFTVSKKSFDTSTSFGKITTFSIVGYNRVENLYTLLSNLPRKLKKYKNQVLEELGELDLNEIELRENKSFIDNLVETLFIGRIGLAIQSISHEFFTPLQGAMSDVSNIETGRDTEESTKRLKKNFQSLERLATAIQYILSTNHDLNPKLLRRVTVHLVVNEIFDDLKSQADEKNVVLSQSYNDKYKQVEAVPNQFVIVLSNIISNAVKYSYKGLDEMPLEVSVDYESKDDFLIIKVINEGCKITKEEISDRLIFNLSYRGEYSQDRKRTGTGSGLFIANEIATAHGGTIDVSSTFCGGSIESGTDRYRNVFSIKWPNIIEE